MISVDIPKPFLYANRNFVLFHPCLLQKLVIRPYASLSSYAKCFNFLRGKPSQTHTPYRMNNCAPKIKLIAAIFFAAVVNGSCQQINPSVFTEVISPQPQKFENNLSVFQSNNQILLAQQFKLLNQGGTLAQLQAWQQQNGTSFADQQILLRGLVAQEIPGASPVITDVTIPAGASQQFSDFIVAKINLMNQDILRNNSLALNLTPGAVPTPPAGDDSALQSVLQQADVVAIQASHTPISLPTSSTIPSKASPQLEAFITQRDRLMKAEIQIYNQYINADRATRDAAMEQWRQANAAQFLQVQQMAKNLAPTTN